MKINPQAFLQQMMNNSQVMKNPMAKNVIELAQKGNMEQAIEIGRNYAKEKGIDFDKELSNFKNHFGM